MQALSNEIFANPEQEVLLPKHKPVYEAPDGFDLVDAREFTKHGQPYEYFHKLRKAAPISWWQIPEFTGYWALTRYDDVRYVDQHAKEFSSQKGGILMSYGNPNETPLPRLARASMDSLINLDQPLHMPLRARHRPFFSAEYVAQLDARVGKEVDRLLDNVERAAHANEGRVNFVEHFSQWLPLYTLSEMLGIPEKDRHLIARWMHYLELASYVLADPDQKVSKLFYLKFLWGVRQMFRYGERILKKRRKHPQDDLLSVIAAAPLDNEPMQQNFLDGSWLLIIFAGNDTTRNSLSGTMRLLTQFPDQKQMLLEEPALIEKMVPEALRLVSPVMYMRRTALADTEVRGQKIAKGEKVVMYYGAANRDPEVFSNPDVMDIHRTNAADHLAFGLGPHVCLGKRIAIMQLQTAYARILERFPQIHWTGKQAHAPNNFVNAISEVEVALKQ